VLVTTGSAGCCARVARGQATAAPPSADMNCRLPMSTVICHAPNRIMPDYAWQECLGKTVGAG